VVIGDAAKYTLVGIHKVGCFGKKTDGKIKFLAPPTPGNYTFTLYLMCDGYLGCDTQQTFKLQVSLDPNEGKEVVGGKGATKKIMEIEEKKEEFDFSDEELDSDSSGSEKE